LAIPLCLGDYLGRFRVIGTTTDFFDKLTFGPENDKKYTFREGRNFETDNPQNRYFEAVLGAEVAREMGLRVGDKFSSTHGDPEGHGHGQGFTVVGILNPSGTPNDRAAFVNMEGFYLMEDHAKPLDQGEHETHAGSAPSEAHDEAGHGHEAGEHEEKDDHQALTEHDVKAHHEAEAKHEEGEHKHEGHDHQHDLKTIKRLLLEEREVTAILVRTVNPLVTPGLKNTINEGQQGQAVLPVLEIYSLFESIVRPFQLLLLGLTALICLVSGISILVSIYNSMNDRRHEIAVMRALGASRSTVMVIILLEAVLLSLGGGAAGWAAAHGLNWIASPRIEAQTGVTVRFWDLAPPVRDVDLGGLEVVLSRMSPEALIVPALILLAIVVGLLPAIAAYRTDVSKSLQT
jgi:putative ABC transport system permease protein